MTRTLFLLILLTTGFVQPGESFSQTTERTRHANPFDTIKYDKVIAYDYNGSPQLQIVVNGQVLPSKGRIFKQKELTRKQVEALNKTLGDSESYGGSTAACFDPHFGIVFFYQNKIVGHISLCLDCNRLYSTPEIAATLSHKTDLCEECYASGFSKRARKDISRLVKELKFSHWQLDSELFD